MEGALGPNQRLRARKTAREGEAQARAELTRFDYHRKINLAQLQVLDNNVDRARELLADCPTHLRRWEWQYVDRLAHQELTTFQHPRIPVCVSFSPDGTRVAVGTFDSTAPVWDLRTGKRLFEMRSTERIGTVAFSPDGGRIAAVSAAGTAICDGHTGQQLFLLKGAHAVVRFCADGKRILTADLAGNVGTWDARTG